MLCCAGKLFIVCLNLEDAVGFVLRQANGPQLTLDFGKKLGAPPNGLKGNQLVDVTGILDIGKFSNYPFLSFPACFITLRQG